MTEMNPAFDIGAIAAQLEERGNAMLDAAKVLRRVFTEDAKDLPADAPPRAESKREAPSLAPVEALPPKEGTSAS
jgi:hypothetical protein